MNLISRLGWVAFGILVLNVFAQAQDFQSAVLREESAPHALNHEALQNLRTTQFIFIDGTLGELWKSNFDPAMQVLNSQWSGVSGAVIRPHTPNTIPENAEVLFRQISQIISQSGKAKTVIIAHSKGGAEVLLMALRHPELVTQLGVVAYGIVSAPIAGTDVIDYVENSCVIANPICDELNRELPSLQTFTPSVIQPIYLDALSGLRAGDRAAVESKLFYVETRMSNADVLSPLYATHAYLSWVHGEVNDGLIPTANEVLYEDGFAGHSRAFGTNLGVMSGDHNSLLNEAEMPATLKYREAFFRALTERMLGI
jgi:pimeloyl-ACP methyl ester carboxylesterase